MGQITGRRYRVDRSHPEWCYQARCKAHLHQFGEHRSEPITVVGAGGARIVATRVQLVSGRHWLEMTVNAPLTAPTEAGRAGIAQRVIDGLLYAVTCAIGGRQ